MKVSGFTFVRNAIKYDYPVKEAILSILPLCDEFIVAVGNSEDGTLAFIKSIQSGKIKIIETVWDDNLVKGGQVLAVETNKAKQAISKDSDWAFYIQGDEVVHEKYHAAIKSAMEKFKSNNKVDGLLFNYAHFYGSYDYLGDSTKWYRKEIRVIKNRDNIYSYKDAQGFRKEDNKKLNVVDVNASIYHYGWVKPPKAMQNKQLNFNKLWHDDKWIEKNVQPVAEFDYSQIDGLKHFRGTHPLVMQERINKLNWKFEFDVSRTKYSAKEKLKRFIEKLTGYRIGEYKNYKLLKNQN
ncbi:MAG: glycosyltransferase family 2 protein [Chlorobi bacterium]|nr:glycosyltransferase family 2 protein [Chlorobiota bacterium]